MTNKSVAYDYMSLCLLKNMNIADSLKDETALDDADKTELTTMLNMMKGLGEDRVALQSMTMEENQLMRGETNKMLMENMHNTFNTIISIKTSLQDVIKDAKTAYRYVLWMYILAFLIGLGLIVVSVVFAAQGKMILSVAFGAIGLIDLVTYFIFKPPLEIQNSRSNLAQLMIIITNWFSDLMNLNTYMANKPGGVSWSEMEKISQRQMVNTSNMIELIEKYGESRVATKPA